MDKDEPTALMLHLSGKRKKPPCWRLFAGQVRSPAVFEAQIAIEAGEKDDGTAGREQPCSSCDVEGVVDPAKHPDGDHG